MVAAKKEPEATNTSRFPMVAVIATALISVALCVGTVFATLYITGYFDRDTTLQASGTGSGSGEDTGEPGERSGQPQMKENKTVTRPQTQYYEIARPLTANVAESRKVMQLTLAVMTHFDKAVMDNVVKHELAIRSSMLAVMAGVKEKDLLETGFKERLAEDLRMAANSVLEEYEDFGGIEKVLFSEFLVQ